jgi:hypothetical protein
LIKATPSLARGHDIRRKTPRLESLGYVVLGGNVVLGDVVLGGDVALGDVVLGDVAAVRREGYDVVLGEVVAVGREDYVVRGWPGVCGAQR